MGKMEKDRIHGICAALLTPRDSQGNLNPQQLEQQLTFQLDKGIRGFALNGATGEFCLTSREDLKRCLSSAASVMPADATLLCGIGGPDLQAVLALGRIAIENNADALLLPMPYFFRYAQDDLEAFVRAVARELPAPILLYNLPQFGSPLEPATVLSLITDCDNVIGIKDSSGSLSILSALTENQVVCSRIVGNDGVLSAALAGRCCDGVVSGVACVLPELIQMMYTAEPGSRAFLKAEEMLSELLVKLDDLPVPWGLKAIADVRQITRTPIHLPASPRRSQQIEELKSWIPAWLERVHSANANVHDRSLRATSSPA
jgi:4-hydroxy-tetrahydrodipicolinate synthase